MPPDPRPGTPQSWLIRARSNLALAKAEQPTDVVLEDICFNAQQAAEKALKAVLQFNGIAFRFVHDINELITTLERGGVSVPEAVKDAVILSGYAVETRYPGDYEPVSEEEARQAVRYAEQVLDWAESAIEGHADENG